MKCPNCDQTLSITERSGIEIDFCPNCRGVWLDRGELDKLIERASRYRDDDDDDDQRRHAPLDHRYQGEGDSYYKKRKSFWADLFD